MYYTYVQECKDYDEKRTDGPIPFPDCIMRSQRIAQYRSDRTGNAYRVDDVAVYDECGEGCDVG